MRSLFLAVIFLFSSVNASEFCDLSSLESPDFKSIDKYVKESCKDGDVLAYNNLDGSAIWDNITVRAKYCDLKKKITEIKIVESLPPSFICILKYKDKR